MHEKLVIMFISLLNVQSLGREQIGFVISMESLHDPCDWMTRHHRNTGALSLFFGARGLGSRALFVRPMLFRECCPEDHNSQQSTKEKGLLTRKWRYCSIMGTVRASFGRLADAQLESGQGVDRSVSKRQYNRIDQDS